MKAGTERALTEALDALRVLGDPTRAWGRGRVAVDDMQAFANAARMNVIAIRDRGPDTPKR